MSWDIFIYNFPKNVTSIKDIPDNFKPGIIGKRTEIISKILDLIPYADFTNSSWGIIDGDNFSIEVNIGNKEEVSGIVLHVRGDDNVLNVITKILDKLNLRALDCSGAFFDPKKSIESFRRWREYKNKAKASLNNSKRGP